MITHRMDLFAVQEIVIASAVPKPTPTLAALLDRDATFAIVHSRGLAPPMCCRFPQDPNDTRVAGAGIRRSAAATPMREGVV